MASLQTRILRVPLAALIGSTLCTAALLAQATQTPVFPNAPQGFDVARQGIPAGRVERVEYTTFPVWKNNLYHLSTLLFR